jgi:hypothetical protein
MAAVMWIEVLARDGDVATRNRIDTAEARVGRAFDNDVVVNDPHVAPHHIKVSRGEDGELVAEDLGTLNGLYAEHGAERVARLSLRSAPGLRIGRTVLRVHDGAHAVAPEKLLTPPKAHLRWDMALGAGLLALILLLNWLNLTTEPNANAILLPIIGLATLLAVWTGLWAVLSRVFFGQAQFALNLRIAITACIAIVIWDLVAETLAFGFAWRGLAEYASLGAWVILAATCYAHLAAIGPRHMKFALGLVFALIASGTAMHIVSKEENREQIGQRATLGTLRPPAFRLMTPASADDFFRDTDGTRASVDQARKKEPPSGSGLPEMD